MDPEKLAEKFQQSEQSEDARELVDTVLELAWAD
jgi:hypothetical protein